MPVLPVRNTTISPVLRLVATAAKVLLSFSIGKPHLTKKRIRYDGSARILVDVTNTGQREGTEVVQLYLHDLACSFGARPVRELKGFQRVTLKPGESQEISFTLTTHDLGCWSAEGKWVIEPGRFEAVIAPAA